MARLNGYKRDAACMMIGAGLGLSLGLLLKDSPSFQSLPISPKLAQRVQELSMPCEGSLNSVVNDAKTLLDQNRETIQESIATLCGLNSTASCPDYIRNESLNMINTAIKLTVFCPNTTVWDKQFTYNAEVDWTNTDAFHLYGFPSIYLIPYDPPNTKCRLLGVLVHEAWHDLGYKVNNPNHDEGTDWTYKTADSIEANCRAGFFSDSKSR